MLLRSLSNRASDCLLWLGVQGAYVQSEHLWFAITDTRADGVRVKPLGRMANPRSLMAAARSALILADQNFRPNLFSSLFALGYTPAA